MMTFYFIVQRSILEKLSKGEDLSEYCDVSKELANTIEKNIFELEIRATAILY